MSTSIEDPLAAANAAVPRIDAHEARRLMEEEGALLVDVREGAELAQTGKLAGAVHVPRGLIQVCADPEMPAHHPEFRKERPIILYCAAGIRSALAGKALLDMGYCQVVNLGGFAETARAGMATEPA